MTKVQDQLDELKGIMVKNIGKQFEWNLYCYLLYMLSKNVETLVVSLTCAVYLINKALLV